MILCWLNTNLLHLAIQKSTGIDFSSGGLEIKAAEEPEENVDADAGMDLSRLEGDEAVMGYWRFEEDEETHPGITQVNDLTKVNWNSV